MVVEASAPQAKLPPKEISKVALIPASPSKLNALGDGNGRKEARIPSMGKAGKGALANPIQLVEAVRGYGNYRKTRQFEQEFHSKYGEKLNNSGRRTLTSE